MADSPKAEQAFADYVALGPKRSLRWLLDIYCQQSAYEPPTRRFRTLADWSVKYGWKHRIAEAISERTMALLSEANELDTATFLETSRRLNERMQYTDAGHLDAVIKIREAVRLKAAASGAGVTVNVTIMQEAERLAAELGISADDLIRDAEKIAASAWEKGS